MMRQITVSRKTFAATLAGEAALILLAACWYGGLPAWRNGDGQPSVTVHFQVAPAPQNKPLARSFSL